MVESLENLKNSDRNKLDQGKVDLGNLVIVRHGESVWNQENRFTGWKDVALSEKGRIEAQKGGKALRERHFEFDLGLYERFEASDSHDGYSSRGN
jgi:hypothetical protein